MTDTVKAWIEERRTIHNEATEGPWVAEYSGETGDCVIPSDAQSTREAVAVTRLFHRTADANAIVDAHNMFPRALDALNAVLKVHSPGEVFTWAEDCADPENHHLVTDVRTGGMLCEDEPLGQFCNGCVPENDTTIDTDEYPWPCPTVQAIEGAINE